MKTIVKNFCATLLLAAAFAPNAAPTADELPVRSTQDVEVVFKSLDRNRDAKISRTEASVKGSDGYLSKQEFAARPSGERFE